MYHRVPLASKYVGRQKQVDGLDGREYEAVIFWIIATIRLSLDRSYKHAEVVVQGTCAGTLFLLQPSPAVQAGLTTTCSGHDPRATHRVESQRTGLRWLIQGTEKAQNRLVPLPSLRLSEFPWSLFPEFFRTTFWELPGNACLEAVEAVEAARGCIEICMGAQGTSAVVEAERTTG
jgi:hypothetical protein